MKTKKIIASVLSVLLIFGSIPMASLAGVDLPELPSISSLLSVKASAADATVYTDTKNGVKFTLSGTDWLITGPSDNFAEVYPGGIFTVPTDVKDTEAGVSGTINKIADGAFFGCDLITEIIIPTDMAISIGGAAFGSCKNLEKVTLKSNRCTFCSNSGAGYNYNEGNADHFPSFYDCSSLDTFVFSSGVKQIPSCVCRYVSSLTNVEIEDVITEIGTYAFAGCRNIKSINADKLTNVNEIKAYAFYDCSGISEIEMPAVDTIGDFAFANCTSLNKITYPNVTTIGNGTFRNTGFTELVISSNVGSIGGAAFGSCKNLEKVTLKSNRCTFCSNSGAGYNYNEGNADHFPSFYDCSSLDTFVFSSGVKQIPSCVCRYVSSLTNVEIEDVITEIGTYAFAGCRNIKSVSAEGIKKVRKIKAYAFYDCSGISEIEMPAVDTIGDFAFANCTSLNKITYPNVTTIGNGAFRNTGFTELVIPSNVGSIGGAAFGSCKSLEKVTLKSNKCTFCSNSGAGYNYNEGNADHFPSFYDCSSLDTFVFSSGVKQIPAYVCRYVKYLNTVIIEGVLESVYDNAFDNCSYIEDIYCPNMTESYWNDNVKTNIGSNNDILSDEAVTYHWGEMPEVKTVTVKFNIDGKITSYTGEAGAALSAPQAKKDGYEFTGWSPAFGGKYPDADTTYTAQFKKIEDEPQESETITVSDASTKVGVTYEKDAFDEAVQLVTKEISDIREIYGSFALTGMNQIGLYDAYMKNSKGEKVQPNKPVTIKLPVPQSAWNQILTVCHIDDSGNRRLFRNVKAVNGYITLEIDHFSGFVIYEDVKISNYTGTLNVDYRTKLTFSIENDEIEESSIHWFVNGKDVKTGSSYIIDTAAEKEYKVQVKVIVGGEIISESETETVKVKTNFFAKLIAFFRNLFGKLPEYVDNIKVK